MTQNTTFTVKLNNPDSSRLNFEENDQQERDAIAKLFLNLYHLQVKGFEISEKKMAAVDVPGSSTFSYELRIKHYDNWCIRTVGVEKLGAGEGSKSKCYKVFYDDVLVVKIPQHPIATYEEYIEQLSAERSIAKELKPEIKSIVPGVSTIMKRVPLFLEKMELYSDDKNYFDSDAFEDRCIARLKVMSSFQKYLKIDGSFVFFMDISQYQFLHDFIRSLHNVEENVQEEILKRSDLVCEFQKFEEKFGLDRIPVWLKINDAFKFYENRVGELIEKHHLKDLIQHYETRSWFFYFISGKKQELHGKIRKTSTDREILARLERFEDDLFQDLNNLEEERKHDIDAYYATVAEFSEKAWFRQNSLHMSCLISGLVQLLALLRKKGVAFRDLKPTNILIADDKSRLSGGKNKTASLGLIDFENTVFFSKYRGRFIDQPLLGGTLSYATPSNFADNTLLKALYKDVSRTLHLQDWQACLCMIFLIVSGERLFENTRLVLFETLRMMKNTFFFGMSTEESFENFSRLFWETAFIEFLNKVETNQFRLDSIEISIPLLAKKMLAMDAIREKRHLDEEMRMVVGKQSVIRRKKILSSLLKMSANSIERWRKDLQETNDTDLDSERTRKWLILFLSKLVSLKRRQEDVEEFEKAIVKPKEEISAYLMLRFMFAIVASNMYLEKWGKHI
jgi:serine/threonine protein kinase